MKKIVVSLLGLTLVACSSVTGVSDYLSGDDNAIKPSPLPEYENSLPLNFLWQSDAGAGFAGQSVNLVPAVSEDSVFAADREGLVFAFDKANGNERWERETELNISAGPGVGEGLVVVGSSGAEILALNAEDGATLWKVNVSSEVLAVPVVVDGVVIVRTIDGRLYGLDATSGGQKWIYDWQVPILTLRGTSTPAADAGMVVVGFATGKMAALSVEEGDLLWEASVSIPTGRTDLERMIDIDADPLIDDGYVYTATFQGELANIELESGVMLWKREISVYAGVAVDWGQLYVTDHESNLWAIDPANGASVWKQIDLQMRKLTAPVVQGDYVVVGDSDGYLHWLSREDGHFVAKTQIDDEGILSTPVVVDDVLYVLTKSGQLEAISIGENVPVANEVDKPDTEKSLWKFWGE
jgi:outer membrane protein assembly factor BamB